MLFRSQAEAPVARMYRKKRAADRQRHPHQTMAPIPGRALVRRDHQLSGNSQLSLLQKSQTFFCRRVLQGPPTNTSMPFSRAQHPKLKTPPGGSGGKSEFRNLLRARSTRPDAGNRLKSPDLSPRRQIRNPKSEPAGGCGGGSGLIRRRRP